MNESQADHACMAPAAAPEPATAGDVLSIELVILDHYGHQTRRLVRSLPAVIGRNDRAEIILTDPWVSHEHCKLVQQDGLLIVCDLGSKNGVFVRGLRVLEADVHSGDCLTLGRTEITVRYREATQANGASAAEEEAAAEQPARPPRPASPHTEELLY